MKSFSFMAGLPRSGSTLISSILNQNPEVHSGPNSPICGIMYNLELAITESEQWSAYPKKNVLTKTVFGVIENYYSDRSEKNIIDKNREWSSPKYFGPLLRNMDYAPKVVVPVRSIVDILASFMYLVENSDEESFIDYGIKNSGFGRGRVIDNDLRCHYLMRPNGIIDNSMKGIYYAIYGEHSQNFHLIEYEDLVENTATEIEKIYDFLSINGYSHNLFEIENLFEEKDSAYGLKDMHKVRPSISKRDIDLKEYVSNDTYNKYSNIEFWRSI